MELEIIVTSIMNWVLSIIALLCVLSLLFFPIATIIAAVVEGQKLVVEGQKRSWKKTKIFGLLSGVGLIGLIAILVVWGLAIFLVEGFNVPNQ